MGCVTTATHTHTGCGVAADEGLSSRACSHFLQLLSKIFFTTLLKVKKGAYEARSLPDTTQTEQPPCSGSMLFPHKLGHVRVSVGGNILCSLDTHAFPLVSLAPFLPGRATCTCHPSSTRLTGFEFMEDNYYSCCPSPSQGRKLRAGGTGWWSDQAVGVWWGV